jgi:2'-5' RNA ligase
VFPVSGPPRALWLGVRAGDQSLSQLHQELGIRLARLGFPPDTRDYSAHLTVARFKDIRRRDGAAVRSLLGANTTVVGECTVTSVTLFRSHLSPKGSHYEHLLRVPLS